jgi:uracil-DNA glycosylase family 4
VAYRYNRQVSYTLPTPESLPFPGNLIRMCEECYLSKACKAPVPGCGPTPARIMLVGQNPGVQEDLEGRPFCGQSGRYLDSLLFQCGVNREDVFITNRCKCKTPNNRELQSLEMKVCAHWLDIELSVVQPQIIVAMGSPAIRHFLGNDAGTIEHLHGKPIERDGRIILPSYHPAAALHDTSKLRQCAEDFQVLRGLVKGTPPSAYHVVNEYPNPVYRVADTPKLIKQMEDEIRDAGEFAIDTEQCRGRFWSAQISAIPGTSWFIPIPEKLGTGWRMDVAKYDATCIVHYYLHEIKYLNIDDDKFVDTMCLAYLSGNSQGLKELAYRLTGIQMTTYTEMVHPEQLRLSAEYLKRTLDRKWPDPPAIEETKWDNKKGAIVTRNKRPWHISRKIDNILKSLTNDESPDPWGKWRNIPPEERNVVESVIGAMPEASLMDIKFEDAVAYSCRDALATLLVYHKLSKIIDDLGLNMVQSVDHRVLPMVNAMMFNGMPVDVEHYKRLSGEYDLRLRVQAAELASMVGHPFNPNSSDQVAAVVYNELGFKPTKLTDSGKISTDDAELKKTGPHPVARGVIQYRGVLKLKTTYADNIARSQPDAEGNPRMHTKLNTTRVETGRLSSSKTEDGEGGNLQNIPTRSKDGKEIKNGFCAPNGKFLLEGDYGQIEVVSQAHLANCKGLIELFNRGGDPHTETAARLFGISLEDAKQNKYRYPCKRAGFGIIYLIGAQGLATQINEYIADLEMAGEPIDIEAWDETTCQKFIDDYYKLYPEIRDYQLEQQAHARRYGYTRDIIGRIRYIPEISCPIQSISEAGGRMAANFPVTSSAQAIIKMAMGELWRELPRTPWADVKVLMQIHDSLIDEVRDDPDYYKPYVEWKRNIMCNITKLRVPIKVDFKIGKRWGELEKIT